MASASSSGRPPYGGSRRCRRLPGTADSRTVDAAMSGPRRVRRLLQGHPRPAAAADVRADRRPAGPRSAVRDAFVRRLAPLAQGLAARRPRGVVRPHAWRHAQRRHTARLWHRDKGLDPEPRPPSTRSAKLHDRSARCCCSPSSTTRRIPEIAREVGLHPDDGGARAADRHRASSRRPPRRRLDLGIRAELRPGRAADRGQSASRGPRSSAAPAPRAAVPTPPWARSPRWPPCSGQRHPGHRPAGVAPSLTDDGRRRPPDPSQARAEPDGQRPAEAALRHRRPGSTRSPAAARGRQGQTERQHAGDGLYTVPGDGTPTRRARGPGAHLPVRHRDAGGRATAAVQATEASRDPRGRQAYLRPRAGWYAGCTDAAGPAARDPPRRGRRRPGTQLVLRSWRPAGHDVTSSAWPAPGCITTTTVTSGRAGSSARASAPVAGLLGRRRRPPLRHSRRPAAARPARHAGGHHAGPGRQRAGSAERGRPPAGHRRSTQPWVGTEPRRATSTTSPRPAATRPTSAATGGRATASTRDLPDPRGRAARPSSGSPRPSARCRPSRAAGVRRRRTQPAGELCDDRRPRHRRDEPRTRSDEGDRALAVWHVTTEVSDDRSLTFLMAIVRRGTAVAQLGFVPRRT